MRSNEEAEILYTFNIPALNENELDIKIYEPILFASEIILPVEINGLPDGQNRIFNKKIDKEKIRSLLTLLDNVAN